jgi:hypothetical protein
VSSSRSLTSRAGRAASVAVLVLSAACQERLTAPADCPTLCPGGYELRDTVLFPVPDGDSAFSGYFYPGQGTSLRVSYQFAPSEDRAVLRFSPRPDSVLVDDTLRTYTIDSVALELSLQYRDSLVSGLKLFLYRLPASVDSTVSFTDVDTAFTPANTIDSFTVVDTTTRYRTVLSGASLARVAIPAGDSGVLALGVQIRASQGTGVRIGSASAGLQSPAFINYVTAQSDTGPVSTSLPSLGLRFNTFVSQSTPPLDPDLLTLGGVPSARTIIRFPWPAYLRDSAQLVRATLELLPSGPIPGLTGDSAFVEARPLLADFGNKSPASSDGLFITTVPILPGVVDTLSLEVRRALTLWQGTTPLPPAFMLQLFPEVSSFTRPTFGSSRTPGLVPRLRITYARKFPFQEP